MYTRSKTCPCPFYYTMVESLKYVLTWIKVRFNYFNLHFLLYDRGISAFLIEQFKYQQSKRMEYILCTCKREATYGVAQIVGDVAV